MEEEKDCEGEWGMSREREREREREAHASPSGQNEQELGHAVPHLSKGKTAAASFLTHLLDLLREKTTTITLFLH